MQSITIDVNSIPSRSRVLEITEEPKGDVDLAKAEIIVAVGRGIGDQEKIHFTAELAEALGGTLACSRPVVDVGWLPRRAAGGRFREERSAESLRCLRHLRRHSAFDRHERFQADYRHQ